MKKLFGLLILFLAFFTVNVKALNEKINITDVKVIDKSSTITVDDPKLEDNAIKSSVKFNKINDFVIYEISFVNNDSYDYTIDKIIDNNTSSNLSIEYDYGDELLASGTGVLRLKLTYKTQLLNVEKVSLDNLEVTMNLTKSDGTKTQLKLSNPTTGDNMIKYVFIFVISVVGIILVKKNVKFKNIKVGSFLLILPFLILPFAIFAAEKFEISIKFTDVEVKGEFEVYDIGIGDSNRKVTYGQPIGPMEEPVKDGYTFDKWVDSDGNEVTSETIITKPISVSPKYNLIEYTITYDLDEGSASNAGKYTVEDEITLNNPVKDGYTFSGWTGFNGNSLQTRVTIPKGTTGNISFKANYSANEDTAYKVIHKYPKLEGGYDEVVENLSGATDTNVTPALMNRDGFTGPDELTTTKIKGNGSTEVVYTYTRNQYTINLDSPYIETTSTTKDYYYGEEIEVSAVDREGYNFTGWSNGETNKSFTLTVTEGLTLVPNYEIIKYTVTFNSGDGLCGEESRSVNYNTKIGDLPLATKIGYGFVGWYNGDTLVDKNFIPTSDVTLVAHYIKSVDSLTIEDTDIEVTKGGTAQINITNSDQIEETYSFSSSNTTIATVSSSGLVTAKKAGTVTITITGNTSGQTKEVSVTINPLTYTVTFDPTDDGQVTTESISVEEGESISSFPTVDKDGYEFVGWFNGDDEVTAPYTPTGDITLTAHYEESNELVKYTDKDNSGTVNLGDYVKIGNDGFWIIAEPEDGKVKLLAEYNLDSDSRQSEDNYVTPTFSDTDYWMRENCTYSAASSSSSSSSSSSESGLNSCEDVFDYDNYSQDSYEYYLYRNFKNNDTENNLVDYINNYKEYLKYDLGVYEILDARLMSYEEAVETGCSESSNSCLTYIANQSYWLGSAVGHDSHDMVWGLYEGSLTLSKNHYYRNDLDGVRPVIEIAAGAIIKYNVSFDSQGGSSVSTMKVGHGKMLSLLPIEPIRENHVFDGWYTDINYTTKVTEKTIVMGDVTYYAKWMELRTVNDLKYADLNIDGSISTGDYVKIGDFDEFWVVDIDSSTKNLKLLPKYSLTSNYRQSYSYKWGSYALIDFLGNVSIDTYFDNYKNYLKELNIVDVKDARLMLYDEATLFGCSKKFSDSCSNYFHNQYFWLGYRSGNYWWQMCDSYIDYFSPIGGMHVSGVRPLIEIDGSIINTITFDYQYDSLTETKYFLNGMSLSSSLDNPTRTGWVFDGWYTDTNYTTEVTEDTIPTGSTTYYAKWKADIAYTDTNEDGNISLGDKVMIGDEGFWVIASPEDGKVKLLAEYNLNSNSRQEPSNNYQAVTFSDDIYWSDFTNLYLQDVSGRYYIYRDKDNNETNNNLKKYINNYKDYLMSIGATNIEDARLMSHYEANLTGCGEIWDYGSDCPEYIANQVYWLGSLYYSNRDTYISQVWDLSYIESMGGGFGLGIIGMKRENLKHPAYDGNGFGIRPLIIVFEDALTGD